jgi:hypothetical protein
LGHCWSDRCRLLNRQVQQDGSVLVEQHDGKGVFLM